MRQFLGIYIPTKKDRERKEMEYLRHFFPYGEEHREKIGCLLAELIPTEPKEYLLLYYVQIKEQMEKCGRGYEEAILKIPPQQVAIRLNNTVNNYFRAVLEADSEIKEDIMLPDADTIRRRMIAYAEDDFV